MGHQPGPERIRYTCDRYKLCNTYLIDVLSYYSIRNDWDLQHPASGVKNLIDGRYKVRGQDPIVVNLDIPTPETSHVPWVDPGHPK